MPDNKILNFSNVSPTPLSPGENEIASQLFCGAMDCLIKMWGELKNEGCYFDKGVIKGARGRTQPVRSKYTPYRIRETKKS